MSYLPHIYPVGATFFITFRLADSLPQSKLNALKEKFNKRKREIEQLNLSKAKKVKAIHRLRKKIFGIFDKQLDEAPYGDCHMNETTVAQIIWDEIFQYDKLYYDVHHISIMPNHVHMLIDTSVQVQEDTDIDETPDGYVSIDECMHLIKGGSAFLINKHLKRSGALWQKESYDHFVRYDEENEYTRISTYIQNNPIKAKLDKKFLNAPYRYST
jgi:REP element-mobilizing transposase RayT